MKRLCQAIIFFYFSFLFWGEVFSQNVAVNTIGTVAAPANLFEVIQQASVPSDYVAIFAKNLSTGTNAYAIWAEASGAATGKYAIVVPPGGGGVGIGTTTPLNLLHIVGSNDNNVNYYSQQRIDGTGAYPLNITGISLNPNTAGVQSHIRFMENGTPKVQIRFNNGNVADNKLKIYSWALASDFTTFDAATGYVGIGTTGPNEQLEITKNFRLPATTGSTVGVIYNGANRYIHNYGSSNFFAGVNAGNFTMTGSGNTGVGYEALSTIASGLWNTATGYRALYANDGWENTANGWYALSANTSGGNNTAIGYSAASGMTSGGVNTAIGSQSMINVTTGNYNVAVGWQSYLVGSYDNSIDIAANGGLYVGASNQAIIGNASHTSIGGQVGWSTLSDARIKNNVQENVPGLSFINELRPVTYNYDIRKEAELGGGRDTAQWRGKYDIEKMQFSGFLAQEVDAAAKKIGYNFSGVDKSGKLWALRYAEFVVPLVKSVQELNARSETQQKEIDAQKEIIEQMRKKIEVLEGKNSPK